MYKRNASIASYITLIGWLLAFSISNNGAPRPSLLKYHLKQGLGLGLMVAVYSIAVLIIGKIVPSAGMILSIISIAFLVLLIIGIIHANKEEEKPLPLFGKMFERMFGFIK